MQYVKGREAHPFQRRTCCGAFFYLSTLLLRHNKYLATRPKMFPLVIGVFVGIVLFFLGKKRAAGLAVLAGFVAFLLYRLTLSS
jgi:hypothetical protein